MLKKTLLSGLFTMSILAMTAQELPKPSPLSSVKQVVGLTNISLEYSRPSVKGRTIFGDLVPYDKVWRLGANAPTKLTTDRKLSFNGKELQPGTYAVFLIPSAKEEWQMVFNTDIEQWGAGDYDEKKNVLVTSVKPQTSEMTESLMIYLDNISAAGAFLVIEWDKTKISVPFTVDTDKAAVTNIENAIKEGKDLDKVYYKAAGYYKDSKKDLGTALQYIDKSLEIKEAHNSMFLKARIYADKEKYKEALGFAEKALILAKAAGEDGEGWIPYIEENMAKWKAK